MTGLGAQTPSKLCKLHVESVPVRSISHMTSSLWFVRRNSTLCSTVHDGLEEESELFRSIESYPVSVSLL